MKLAATTLALLLLAGALPASSSSAKQNDITPLFRSAGLPIENLQVYEVGGVVLIRGRSMDRAAAEEAGRIAVNLGFTRIANLVQVVQPPDDVAIERIAERELGRHRSLDGCNFHIDSDGGIVRVGGTVRSETQKDYAIELLRSIDGVREVHADLQRR
jgi:osmotically-inducible protein OsmY